jgi:hypothetical protein
MSNIFRVIFLQVYRIGLYSSVMTLNTFCTQINETCCSEELKFHVIKMSASYTNILQVLSVVANVFCTKLTLNVDYY